MRIDIHSTDRVFDKVGGTVLSHGRAGMVVNVMVLVHRQPFRWLQ
jgi:hypothetical protein